MTDKEPLSRPAEEPSAGQAGTPDVPPQDAAPPVPTPEGEAGGANPEQEHTYPSIFDKPDHTNRKQAKERKLSRGARNVILTLVLCVALAGSVFGIYRFLPKQEEENTSSSGMTLSLFDYSQYVTYDSSLTESEGVKNILVTNPTGSYEVVYSIVEKTQTNSVTGEEETGPAIEWSIAGQEGVRFDSDTIQYLVGDLLKVIYTTVYNTDANALNAEGITLRQECGFDNPTATMTVNFNDGKTYTIYLGSELPTGGSYYLMQSGDDTIYVAEDIDVSYFLRGISYYVSQQMVPMLEESDADSSYFADGLLNRFDEITISGRNFAQPIVLEMADSSQIAVPTDYRMTSPVQQAADTDKVTTLLSPLANGLEATECLVMKATSDDIREYGLDSPICEVRYVVDGETYVLKVGNQVQEGYYAASFSGTQSIYRVAESSVSFAFTPADDYRSILLYVTNITDVAKLTVDAVNDSGNLISETFTLRHSTEETESGSTTTLVVNDSEGNAIVEDDFREFYQGIIGLTAASWVDDGQQSATPKLTITLEYLDGSSDVIRLSEYSSRRYFYTLNGEGNALVLASSVGTLLDQFSSLLYTGR